MKKNILWVSLASALVIASSPAFSDVQPGPNDGVECNGQFPGGRVEIALGRTHAVTYEKGLGVGRGSKIVTEQAVDVLSWGYYDDQGNSPALATNTRAFSVDGSDTQYRVVGLSEFKLTLPKPADRVVPYKITFNGDEMTCDKVVRNVRIVE